MAFCLMTCWSEDAVGRLSKENATSVDSVKAHGRNVSHFILSIQIRTKSTALSLVKSVFRSALAVVTVATLSLLNLPNVILRDGWLWSEILLKLGYNITTVSSSASLCNICFDFLPFQCGNMAREGFRTLVVAKKILTEDQYQDFEVCLSLIPCILS